MNILFDLFSQVRYHAYSVALSVNVDVFVFWGTKLDTKFGTTLFWNLKTNYAADNISLNMLKD